MCKNDTKQAIQFETKPRAVSLWDLKSALEKNNADGIHRGYDKKLKKFLKTFPKV